MLDRPATASALHRLRDTQVLSASAFDRALALLHAPPTSAGWRRFASRATLILGGLLCLAAAVFFIAANWHHLDSLTKFALLEVAIAGCALAAWKASEPLHRQLAITFAAVLFGPLLALYGQTYQTGADAFELFMVWAVLCVPLALVARFAPLWAMALALGNVALSLCCEQLAPFGADTWNSSPVVMAAFNAVALVVVEVISHRVAVPRWLRRSLAAATVLPALPHAALFVLDERWLAPPTHWGQLSLLVVGVSSLALAWRFRRDRFVVSLVAFAVMAVANAWLAMALDVDTHVAPWRLVLLAGVMLLEVTVFASLMTGAASFDSVYPEPVEGLRMSGVWDSLEREDLVARDSRSKASAALGAYTPSMPWYARAVTGVYGWLAALCLLGAAYQWHLTHAVALAVGLGALVSGIMLRRSFSHGFLSFAALALCLGGEVQAIVSFESLVGHDPLISTLFVLGLELTLLLTYPDSLMRLLCTGGVALAVFRLFGLTTPLPDDVPVMLGLFAGLALFHLAPRLATRFRHAPEVLTPVAFGFTLVSLSAVLSSLSTYSGLELGVVARVGAALVLAAQLALALHSQRAPLPVWLGALVATIGFGVLSFGTPGVLAALAVLVCAKHHGSKKLLAAAVVFLGCFYFRLYAEMDATLLHKSMLLAGNGLCCLLLWRLVDAREAVEATPFSRRARFALAVSLASALLVVNGAALLQERVVRSGDVMLLELGPTDPRSLMQGDYMTLRYRLGGGITPPKSQGRLVVTLNDDRVATAARLDDGHPLASNEHLLMYRRRAGWNPLRLGAESYFFEEGSAARFSEARYGELRVNKRGKAVLVGLRDAERRPL